VQVNDKYHQVSYKVGLDPNEKMQMLAEKWRKERNFWIAAMCLLLWIVLARYHALCKHNARLAEQVRTLGGNPGPSQLPEASDASGPSTSTGASTGARHRFRAQKTT
jgi:hypothetical protein